MSIECIIAKMTNLGTELLFDGLVKSHHSGENRACGIQAEVQMVCPPTHSGGLVITGFPLSRE